MQKRLLYFTKLNRTITYKIYADSTYICLSETFILEDKLYMDNIANICTYYMQRLKITSVYNDQIKSFITLQQLTILTTICRIYLKTKSLCLNDINNFCILNDLITVRRFTFFKEIIQVCYDVRWKEFLKR